MRILIIGGTRFVGRHLVAAAIARGHAVTILHRGVECSGAPGAEHLHADRDGDLGVLDGRVWDATVDVCAYWPRQVVSLADALGERGGRHVLISTVSVYAEAPEPGLDEQAPLVAPLGLDGDAPAIDEDTYGGLKVGCEHVAEQRHAGGLLIIRPTYIVGPYDPTARFPYWVDRLARGGTVLCPGSPDAPFQYIDARDLAAFTVGLLGAGDEGAIHVVNPPAPYSFAEMLEMVSRGGGPRGDPTGVGALGVVGRAGGHPVDAAAVDRHGRSGVRAGPGPCARARSRPARATAGRDGHGHAGVVLRSVLALVCPQCAADRRA